MTPLPLTALTSRDNIGEWLTRNGLTGEAVELGVYDGSNAVQILANWPGILHLVDPWKPQDEAVYVESPNLDFEAAYELTERRMRAFSPRAIFHVKTSDEFFLELAGTQAFDFVYIDGNHSGEQVERDIRQWWTLLKTGGVMGGHDYMESEDDRQRYQHCREVKPAVDAFVKPQNLSLHITREPSPPSWWVQKPILL